MTSQLKIIILRARTRANTKSTKNERKKNNRRLNFGIARVARNTLCVCVCSIFYTPYANIVPKTGQLRFSQNTNYGNLLTLFHQLSHADLLILRFCCGLLLFLRCSMQNENSAPYTLFTFSHKWRNTIIVVKIDGEREEERRS